MIKRVLNRLRRNHILKKFKNISSSSRLALDVKVYNPDNLVMEGQTNIDSGATIMNTRAKLIMKKYSGAAIGLTVITGNHMSVVGKWFKDVTDSDKDLSPDGDKFDRDVIIDEDVWIGANVTLLAGTHIKRGAIIGSGSVVRGTVPPYAIVIGNPSKVIAFRFTPAEIIMHEKSLYKENQRIPIDTLTNNYKKYLLDRIKDISNFIKN